MATQIPSNRARFSLAELTKLLGIAPLSLPECHFEGVTTDSRSNVAGKLFVALSGGRFDGHDYLQQAAASGATAALVEREPGHPLPIPVLKVNSTLRALGDIAKAHRNRWRGKVIAIAGSAGKTTTRVACQALFEAAFPGRVLGTEGNLNNQIGVPMTLLGLSEAHDFAVIEVGTNSPGEVRRLTDLCQPDSAVLTLIGLEHSEGLGDLEGIEREEGALFEALRDRGVAIGNGDDERVQRQMAVRATGHQQITYGCRQPVDYSVAQELSDNLDLTAISIQRSKSVGGGRFTFESALLGMPGALAAAAAVAALEAQGVKVDPELASIAYGRAHLGEAGRLRLVKLEGDIVVLDDSYNANPPSMASSIAVASGIAQRRNSRLVLVLGEMRELGELSEREHRLLGTRLGGVSQLVAVAGDAKWLHESAVTARVRSEFCATAELAAECVESILKPKDVVLVKGSRGVKLETVVQRLASQKGRAA